jgi:hypothetical protein
MDQSPFGTLPAELRNRVYEYLLDGGTKYHMKSHFNERGVAELKASLRGHPLALAQTCRITHEEYTPLFYSSNEFMIWGHVGAAVLKLFDTFTSIIGPRNTGALRDIVFRVLEPPMDSFESVCSTHNDTKAILERTAALKHEMSPQCRFRVQVDLVHFSNAALANASFFLDLDFNRLGSSWDVNMDNLQRKRERFTRNDDFKPIIFILEECRQHLRNIMGYTDNERELELNSV